MSNDRTDPGADAANGLPLPASMGDWTPYEIVYVRYTYDERDPSKVYADPESYVVCETDPKAFALARLRGKPLPGHKCTRRRHPKDPTPRPLQPYDIYVGCQCYIVIELDPERKWQFMPGRPAITMQGPYGDSNGELHHLMPDGSTPTAGPDGDGCRIIWFGVKYRDEYQHQQFHCNIDFSKLGLAQDPTQVDPDVPNDGGRFPLIPRTVCPGGDGSCGAGE